MGGLKKVCIEVVGRWNYSGDALKMAKKLVVALEGIVKGEVGDGIVVTVKLAERY
jgi:hypothetical protein